MTRYAVGRSEDNLWSPLDSVSGCRLASTSFRVGPTRSACRRALGCIPECGNETAYRSVAAASEPVASRPHTAFPVERSILHCLPLAWENRKGGTPFVRFFPPFLAGQEMEPSETSKEHYKLQLISRSLDKTGVTIGSRLLPLLHWELLPQGVLFALSRRGMPSARVRP